MDSTLVQGIDRIVAGIEPVYTRAGGDLMGIITHRLET